MLKPNLARGERNASNDAVVVGSPLRITVLRPNGSGGGVVVVAKL